VRVIGAGVVGLAVARELAMAGREVIVLEAAESIGTHTSSRNSEVIHAGLYYPQGSLKARLCIEGKHRLYAYASTGFRTGASKIVVGARERVSRSAYGEGQANGVTDLRLSGERLHEFEPEVRCVAGFLSPSTGIVTAMR
jgi:L-2-hydroxyglutarate oxidase LhgO